MSNSNNSTPVLSQTPPLNVSPNASPSLNATNLSQRLQTLKRKTNGQENNKKEETPMKRPALGPTSEERRRMYARTKNVNVVWRTNPETGEAEMLKMPKQSGKGRRKSKKSRKSKARR